MIKISQTPSRRMQSVSGIFYSNWVALHNPIVYKFQRKDLNVSSVVFNSSGKVKVTLSLPISLPDMVSVGDSVYINSGLYDQVASVDSVLSSTQIVLNLTHIGDSSFGYINLNTSRRNYRASVQVLELDSSDNYNVISEVSATPDSSGLIKIDIHEWVKEIPQTDYENLFDYQAINSKDLTLSGRFNIKYKEVWDGHPGDDFSIIDISDSTSENFVNAAMQVNKINGQNMAEYVPFPTPLIADAKWLTLFDRPTIFRGYPFDLQFIFSDQISGVRVNRATIQRDINGSEVLAQVNDALDPLECKYVNRISIPVIDPRCKILEIWLEVNDSILEYSRYADDYADNYDEIIPI